MSDSPNQFVETVEGIGTFTFAKRTMRNEIRITVEKARLTENVDLPPYQDMFINAVCALKVLVIEGPDDTWTPEGLDAADPFDDEAYGRVLKVWSALRGKEETFRTAGAARPPGGEAPVGDV